MGVELGSGKTVQFKDVPDSVKPYIEKAIALIIIAGKSETQFAPNEKLKREQAFVIAVRGIETDKPYSVEIL
jgi:2',3'-cyclic-nucleotide 2'-phosphodiesterase/3'-nucleotidase